MDDDLERHHLRWRMRGFPIYDDHDYLRGYIDEPEWEWDALTSDQQAVIRQTALRLQTRDLTWDEAFPYALGDYGIACPHEWQNHEPTQRECRWCRVWELLPGLVVEVAGRTMRVANPPPPILRIPVGADADGLVIDEYVWVGTHYQVAPG